MARHSGPVLVDTNAVLECFRVSAWRALAGGYGVETVEGCVTETQAGFQKRRPEQQIDAAELRKSLVAVHPVGDAELAVVAVRAPDIALDVGERSLWAHALTRKEVVLSSAALAHLVEDYARDPGVRGLEQLLKKILRKVARKLAESPEAAPIHIGVRDLEAYVGKPRFREQAVKLGVGLATGLAWTAMGGTTLTLEATVAHRDSRGLKITGQLGKVMQESAEIAYSYITSNLARFGADEAFFDKAFVHLHVPEGAVPKDGPSAGISMATALLSLALGRAPAAMAMTGELTLTGEVLPIGGVREKLLAAKRLGIGEVILPKANEVDVGELPASVPEGLVLHYAAHFKDVARLMFGIRMRPAKGKD